MALTGTLTCTVIKTPTRYRFGLGKLVTLPAARAVQITANGRNVGVLTEAEFVAAFPSAVLTAASDTYDDA